MLVIWRYILQLIIYSGEYIIRHHGHYAMVHRDFSVAVTRIATICFEKSSYLKYVVCVYADLVFSSRVYSELLLEEMAEFVSRYSWRPPSYVPGRDNWIWYLFSKQDANSYILILFLKFMDLYSISEAYIIDWLPYSFLPHSFFLAESKNC